MWRNAELELHVYEGASAFYIVDERTGKTCGIGDGVDWLLDDNGEPLDVGTDEFYAALERMVAEDGATLREAYFGE